MNNLTILLTLLTLTNCAPKLTPERIKWAECYCKSQGYSLYRFRIRDEGSNIECMDINKDVVF